MSAPDDVQDYFDPLEDECPRCGGDGYVDVDDAPELWLEDLSPGHDLVRCPDCKGKAAAMVDVFDIYGIGK